MVHAMWTLTTVTRLIKVHSGHKMGRSCRSSREAPITRCSNHHEPGQPCKRMTEAHAKLLLRYYLSTAMYYDHTPLKLASIPTTTQQVSNSNKFLQFTTQEVRTANQRPCRQLYALPKTSGKNLTSGFLLTTLTLKVVQSKPSDRNTGSKYRADHTFPYCYKRRRRNIIYRI